MKIKLIIIIVLTIVLFVPGSAQKEFKNLNSTPKEWHDKAFERLKAATQTFINNEDKTQKDSFQYFKQIAYIYADLGESADTVFYYIDKFLTMDRFWGCYQLIIHEDFIKEGENGMYWGKLNRIKYESRLFPCEKYLDEHHSAETNRIKNDSTLDQQMISLIQIMFNNDQRYRIVFDYKKQQPLDQRNQQLLDSIFTNYGFPGRTKVSMYYASHIITIFLHTDEDFQGKWLPLIIQAFKKNEIDKGNIKIVLDRYHTRKFNKQFFGSQRILDNDRWVEVPRYTAREQREILQELNLTELIK